MLNIDSIELKNFFDNNGVDYLNDITRYINNMPQEPIFSDMFISDENHLESALSDEEIESLLNSL